MIPQIFVSYSRKDSDFVRRLVDDLTSRGVDIWLDQRDIKVGERWDTSVQNGLRESDYFMVVLSPESVGSENVMDEIAYAMSKAKHVFPILFRDCDVPYRLARVQYVDFRESYEDGLERLIEQIQLAGVPIRSVGPRPDGVLDTHTQGAVSAAQTPMSGKKEGASAPRSKAKVPVWIWAVGGMAGVAVIVLLILIARGSSPAIPSTPEISPVAKSVNAAVTPTSVPAVVTSAPDTAVPATPTVTATEKPVLTPSATASPIPSVSDVRFCNRPCTETGATQVSSYPEKTKYVYLTLDYDHFNPDMQYTRTWSNNGQEWIRYECTWQGTENGSKNFRLFDTGGLRSGLWVMQIITKGEVIAQAEVVIEGSYDYWAPAGLQSCPDF